MADHVVKHRARTILKRLLVRFALAAGVSVLCLAVCELGLRLFYFGSFEPPAFDHVYHLREPHPTRGWALLPDCSAYLRTRDYAVLVKTNSRGFRDVEHAYEKPEGAYRIVVLGDSFMEAYQVPLQESFPRLLESELTDHRVEVVNLGVGGYGTIQEYVTLKEVGLLYKPDLVLLALLPTNDTRNNHPTLQRLLSGADEIKSFGRPYLAAGPGGEFTISPPDYERSKTWAHRTREALNRKRAERPFYHSTLLYDMWCKAAENLRGRVTVVQSYDPNLWLGPYLTEFSPARGGNSLPAAEYARLWEEAFQITGRTLIETNALSRKNGAEFVVFLVPARIQVDAAYQAAVARRHPSVRLDLEAINARLLRHAGENGLRALDLLPSFREAGRAEEKALFHQIDDRHWNAAGHRLAARQVAAFLRSELLSGRTPQTEEPAARPPRRGR